MRLRRVSVQNFRVSSRFGEARTSESSFSVFSVWMKPHISQMFSNQRHGLPAFFPAGLGLGGWGWGVGVFARLETGRQG